MLLPSCCFLPILPSPIPLFPYSPIPLFPYSLIPLFPLFPSPHPARSVTNRGVVSVGVTRLAATSSLFNHAHRISRHLSSLCSVLTSLNASSTATVAAQLRLARAALPRVTLPPAKQATASASLATIAAQIGYISQQAGGMYGQLAQLQQQAGYASQLDSPGNLTAVSGALQRGWGRVFAFASNVQKARAQLNKAAGTVALSLVNQTVPANQKTAKMTVSRLVAASDCTDAQEGE